MTHILYYKQEEIATAIECEEGISTETSFDLSNPANLGQPSTNLNVQGRQFPFPRYSPWRIVALLKEGVAPEWLCKLRPITPHKGAVVPWITVWTKRGSNTFDFFLFPPS